jgi:hypothetical protein
MIKHKCGKYTVTYDPDIPSLKAQTETSVFNFPPNPDNLVLAMLQEIDELKKRVRAAVEELTSITDDEAAEVVRIIDNALTMLCPESKE